MGLLFVTASVLYLLPPYLSLLWFFLGSLHWLRVQFCLLYLGINFILLLLHVNGVPFPYPLTQP